MPTQCFTAQDTAKAHINNAALAGGAHMFICIQVIANLSGILRPGSEVCWQVRPAAGHIGGC